MINTLSLKNFIAIFSFSLATLASANNIEIPTESENLYFEALPYLDKIDKINNEIISTRDRLPANEVFPAQQKKQYMDDIQDLIREGLPLLRRSAEAGNPAAQYRLALMLSTFEPGERSAETVCALLRSSLNNGFIPAGLQMTYFCPNDVKTSEFQTLIDALPENQDHYSKYYPQPTMMPGCDFDSRAQRNPVVLLDEKAFRANLYLSLANQMSIPNLKKEQFDYLNKAAKNGCVRAISRLSLGAGN